ncbi:von Willebrand factor A domain-containing protein 1 [Clupea harengus]|uniref:von Willebrand factor A domain-containing protein 1 n=1 Tax=Clupea harengus TaxID=7950 RepID=A0A6P3VUJ4_CLUHA|nr:von Willebrand factor A domain-containing protein 1 [Clupea harengus]
MAMGFRFILTLYFVSVFLCRTNAQTVPDTVLNCCEGDVLVLLDASGSIASYEFSHMVSFLAELLQPFSLGPDEVRFSLLLVGTEPRLEFGFETHRTQQALQAALRQIKQLRGDTNTEKALEMARDRVLPPGVPGGTRPNLPRVLLWLTDGVDPGPVREPMKELRDEGVKVLVVSTGHGNFQVLRQVVSPPVEDHLYFVDIEDISIITEDVRNAIIEIIRAERLQVRDVSSRSASLHWRPVLAGSGYYDITFGPIPSGAETSPGGGPGTSPGTSPGHYQRITRPGDATNAQLTGLRPGTKYKVTLRPESNLNILKTLTTDFTTQPEVLSPSVVTVSESTANSVRVSWGPVQPDSVQSVQVEYSALPTGKLQIAKVNKQQNSTVLRNLQPDTQYLVTVSAKHASGSERAMSVKVCTQEVLPALADLQLTTVGSDSVQVRWKGAEDGLRGYWVTWEGDQSRPSQAGAGSSLYLPPTSLSTTLKNMPPSARVCVSPVYRTARGEGLCCSAHFKDALTWGYKS